MKLKIDITENSLEDILITRMGENKLVAEFLLLDTEGKTVHTTVQLWLTIAQADLLLSKFIDLDKAFKIITEMELWNDANVEELNVNEVYQLIQDSTMGLRKALGDE